MSLDTITHLIEIYRYWILVPLAFIEGPIVAFVAGGMSSLGYFNPYIALAIFLIRDVLVDTLCYYIGHFAGEKSFTKRWLAKAGVGDEQIAEIHNLWLVHGGKTMFFSKLSYGLSAGFLIVAGIVAMPFRKFFAYAITVAVLQYGVLFVVGYYFINSFGTVANILDKIQYAVLGITLIATLYFAFKWYMRKRLIAAEEAEKTH